MRGAQRTGHWVRRAGLVACTAARLAAWSPPVIVTPATRAAVEVTPRSAAERAFVAGLSDDVWSEADSPGEPIVVVLDDAQRATVAARGVPSRIVIGDVDAVARRERARIAIQAQHADFFDEFRDLRAVHDHLDSLAAEHPGLARVATYGTSLEGRPIRALEISRGGGLHVALTGGQHAREWLAVMTATCVADRLLTHQAEPRFRRVLDAVSFVITPVVNPDGYAYSWTTDRYWRKNRRDGHGVDLNRNYDVAWGGASDDPASPNFQGPAAFSEPETQAMRALFTTNAIDAHIDFHAYSQVILYPWSHQPAPPADQAAFVAIADRMATAVEAAHGVPYAIRPGASLRAGIGGTLGDWAYAAGGTLSMLVELRPGSSRDGGFVVPPDQIEPTCDEGLAATLALAEWLIEQR